MPNNVEGRAAVRAVHVLRHPAVELVLVVADRRGRLAHRRRQSDQEGAVPGRGAADRQRAARTWCTSSWACRFSSSFLIVYRHSPDPVGPALVSRRRRSCSSCSRPALALILAALTVHFRDIRDILAEPADALVLRDADHLSVVPAERPAVQAAVRSEPVHPPGGVVPGDPVLPRAGRALEVAAGARRRRRSCCSSPATGCSTGCATRSPRWYDAGDRARQRLEDLPPLRRPAVRDAEERAAAAQHPARPAAERDVSGADRRVLHACRRDRPSASSAGTDRARARR